MTIDEAVARLNSQNAQIANAMMSLARAMSKTDIADRWIEELDKFIAAEGQQNFLLNLRDTLAQPAHRNTH
ncbi:hypothetical protein SAMN05421774_11258 [Gemmobacter megaterium]|uniref:Uncharacterized protein n=1 Tax=Gemmobacter megaterium TaxID=1086013 RepID=A0A1N7QIR2_9RHOB|nr:hypothetical protein [Gemmobacter megaterium]SIT22755.1 hypothetical protein SAMN05421774_11258 [Gemmobacter megaterium]